MVDVAVSSKEEAVRCREKTKAGGVFDVRVRGGRGWRRETAPGTGPTLWHGSRALLGVTLEIETVPWVLGCGGFLGRQLPRALVLEHGHDSCFGGHRWI